MVSIPYAPMVASVRPAQPTQQIGWQPVHRDGLRLSRPMDGATADWLKRPYLIGMPSLRASRQGLEDLERASAPGVQIG